MIMSETLLSQDIMSGTESSDLTTLLNQLCASFVGKDQRVHYIQPKLTRAERIRTLRIKANNVLFQQMKGPHFVRGLCKLKKRGRVSLSEIDKINWYIHQLRCNRRYDDANKFEQLMKSLQNQDGHYEEGTRTILQFLVCLANIDNSTEQQYVGDGLWQKMPQLDRNKKNVDIYPNGPPVYGDSRLRLYTGFHYMHYPSYIFDGIPTGLDSYSRNDTEDMNAKIFTLEPESGLHGRGWFTSKEPLTGYERNVQNSLFGALVHSRVSPQYSMYTKLSIPDLPESRPREINIPKQLEISEDEGFAGSLSRSASRDHLSPRDTSWEERVEEEDDVWDLAIKAKPKTHYVWEQVGRNELTVPERPYLTESSIRAVDELYKLELSLLQMIDPSVMMPTLRQITMRHLVADVLNLLIGVPSESFVFNEDEQLFVMDKGTYISGRTPEALQSLCQPFVDCGTNYHRIYTFSTPPILDSVYQAGLVFQAFTSAIRKYLQHYRGYLLRVPKDKTLLQINFMLSKIMRQMKYLAALCKCDFGIEEPDGSQKDFPTGVQLLSYLYQETLDSASSPNYPMLLSMLHAACGPYLMFIQDWVFEGVCRDVYDEFMIQVNADFLRFRDKHYWTNGYVVMTKYTSDAVPLFLREFADSMFVCGKAINLLKLIAPQHFLFRVEHSVPRVMITFSEEELYVLQKQCQAYMGRMNELARQHTMTREKLIAIEEQKKQDIVVKARKQASKQLEKYNARTLAIKKAEDVKKRKEFKELKEQMQEDLQRRANEKEKEKEEDKERIGKVTRQELLEGQIEAELEAKARQDVVDYYEGLMREATMREQHALWWVRRLQLDAKRHEFFKQQNETLSAELAKNPLPTNRDVPRINVHKGSDSSFDETDATHGEMPNWAKRAVQGADQGHIEINDNTQPKAPVDLPKWAEEGLKNAPPVFGFDAYSPDSIPKWAKKGLESDNDEPIVVHEHQYATDLADGIVRAGSEGEINTAEKFPRSAQKPCHVSDESAESEARPGIKILQEKNVHMESSGDMDTKRSIKSVNDKHVSQQTEQTMDDNRTRIKVNSAMYANKQSEEVEKKRHLRMIDDRHANVQSVGSEDALLVPRLRRFEDKHSGIQSEEDEWKIKTRSRYGHASDTTEGQVGLNVPRLKKHETMNAFKETSMEELRSYHVKCHKKSVAGQSVDKETEVKDVKQRPMIKIDVNRHASKESEFVDEDLLRIERFQLRNKRGHASDSSVQRLLYGDTYGRKQSMSSVTEETFVEEEVRFASDILLEPFQDRFDMLERPPMPDLLANVIVDTYSGFSDVTTTLSDDVRAYRFLPLSALLKKSVSAPLLVQIGLVNRCLIDWFIGELKIGKVFAQLRSFLFMEDGEFGQSVSDQLFEKLATSPKPHEMLNPMFLNGVLNKAIQYSSSADAKDITSNLSFVLKHMPNILQPNAVNALDCLELTYRVDWPLNIIVTDTCLTKYGQIFTFMLQLKRVVWTLKDVWHRLKRDAVINSGANALQFRQLQLYRQEMQHFVKVMQGYIANQIIDVTWREFLDDLEHKVETLDDLHHCHAEYLNKCILRCLLNKKAKAVMKVITDIFGLILKFRNQLVSRPWQKMKTRKQNGSGDGHVQHPGFLDMCATYTSFQEYSLFLFKVVRKLTLRGYQPHLQELLLRLDFNEYYSQSL